MLSHNLLQVATVLQSAGPACEATPNCCTVTEADCRREDVPQVHTTHMLIV